jgi:uncharacterized membrane protein YjjB (DUF3815 family)
MKLDAKSLLATLIVLGTFTILGIYVYKGTAPDAVIASILSGALVGVVGFYFGHQNGTVTALASTATSLATQALDKRQPPVVLPVTLTAVMPPPATPPERAAPAG